MVRHLGATAALLATVACGLCRGEDWSNWRGPKVDGISRDAGATLPWKVAPKVVWERPIGSAFSSVTGVGDRVYTCGTEEGKQVIFCLNAASGDGIWKQPIEAELKERQGGDGTRATPTIDGGKVYIFGALGTALCLDAATGKEVWKRSFGAKPQWAYAGSVLVEGTLAILSPGKANGGLVALDKDTGEPVWKAGEDGAGYATPYAFTLGGKRYVVGFLAKSLIIVEAATGRQVWSGPWKTSYDVNASTPFFTDGHLFVSSGYKTGCALFKIEPAGDGLKVDEVWRNKAICNKFHTAILHEGKLYSGDENSLKCVDLKTGATAWDEKNVAGEKSQNASLLLKDGWLLCLSEGGKLSVAKASPEGFKPEATVPVLSGRCWTVPTINNGRLYVRNFEKIVCLEL